MKGIFIKADERKMVVDVRHAPNKDLTERRELRGYDLVEQFVVCDGLTL